MNIRGAIFDLDGTLTDSMYIWQKAPVDLVRRYGGDPPEDLARDLKEMGRREAAEYLRSRFSLSTTPEELMDTLNNPAPYAPMHHTQINLRADDIYLKLHLRFLLLSYMACLKYFPAPSYRIRYDDVRV